MVNLNSNEIVVHSGTTMKIIVPERQLGNGSVQIVPISNEPSFAKWKGNQNAEAHELIQKIAQIWEKKGIHDYLVYGKESSNGAFSWEIVPYEKSTFKFWKQFIVLWKITFGTSPTPRIIRQKVADDLKGEAAILTNPVAKVVKASKNIKDAFCNPDVIARQLVFQGKKVNVLYNHAPIAIGEGKLHFLITPKDHCQKFTELSQEVTAEADDLSQKLVKHYKSKKFDTAYVFNKNGEESGQTVSHWHQHLVFTATKIQEFFGKLLVLLKMLFGAWPMSKSELAKRVSSLKAELATVLC